MDVALHRRHEHLALGLHGLAGGGLRGLLGLHERGEIGDRLLHHAGRFHDLREEHLAGAEEVADDVHAGHERALDDQQRSAQELARLLGVLVDVGVDALDEGVLEAFLDRRAAPGLVGLGLGGGTGGLLLQLLAVRDEPFRGIGAAVEQHVLDEPEQVLGDLLINLQHAGVDDAHVQARADGMVEEGAVHRLADVVVAPEAEADVRHAAADLGEREVLLDPAGGLDEVDRIVVVIGDAGGDGEDVRVEDDVLGRESDGADEQVVAALADLALALL